MARKAPGMKWDAFEFNEEYEHPSLSRPPKQLNVNRECLGCFRSFKALGLFNRICEMCKNTQLYKEETTCKRSGRK